MEQGNEPQISVIIPVYKAERYIEDCVSSVQKQTFSNFEVILVNDGSPDRSGEICDRLASEDGRIHVIHKENGGAATARNAGLDVAKGRYFAFVDGDDLLHPRYLEFLLNLLQKSGADFAMCHYDFFEQEPPKPVSELSEAHILLCGDELLESFHEHYRRVSLISLCMKVFKREIFEGLRIPEGYIEEDSMSLPLILERAKCIARSEEKLYYWRVTPGSVTRSGFTAKSFAYIEVSRFQAEFFVKRKSKEANFFKREYLQRVLYYYYKVCDEKPELMKDFCFYRTRYRKLLPSYIWARGMAVCERIAYILFFIAPKAARCFYEQVYGERQN